MCAAGQRISGPEKKPGAPSKLWQIGQSKTPQCSVQVKAGEWRPEDPQSNERTGVLIDPCLKSRELVGNGEGCVAQAPG